MFVVKAGTDALLVAETEALLEARALAVFLPSFLPQSTLSPLGCELASLCSRNVVLPGHNELWPSMVAKSARH